MNELKNELRTFICEVEEFPIGNNSIFGKVAHSFADVAKGAVWITFEGIIDIDISKLEHILDIEFNVFDFRAIAIKTTEKETTIFLRSFELMNRF